MARQRIATKQNTGLVIEIDDQTGGIYSGVNESNTTLKGGQGQGTVTNTQGPLDANQVVIGNGGNDAKTLGSVGNSGDVLTSQGVGQPPIFAPPAAAAHAVYNETPSGTVDGTNVTFTLAHAPSPSATLRLYQNGLRLSAGGVDFTLSGSTITFVSAPQSGDILLADYGY